MENISGSPEGGPRSILAPAQLVGWCDPRLRREIGWLCLLTVAMAHGQAAAMGVDSSRFAIGRMISGGAMGAVFEATLDGRQVAAKTHHAIRDPQMYGLLDDASARRTIADECRRELSALSVLSHANIIAYFGASFTPIGPDLMPEWIFMERAAASLHDRLLEGPVPIKRYCLELADGLAHIHERKLMHRDLKPKNILLADNGVLKIADLGLAKVVRSLHSQAQHTMVGNTGYVHLLFLP